MLAVSRPRRAHLPRLQHAHAPRTPKRAFALTARRTEQHQQQQRRPLHQRLAAAWRDTPTKWYPLPLGTGLLLLLALQARKKWEESPGASHDGASVHVDDEGREVVRLKGPWQVHVLGALPLRNLSRLWGWANDLELPVWFRPLGFRLYAAVFGCNLDEMAEPDLRTYKSLGDFFYRTLRPGVRPVSDAALVSPADGRVLHFGAIQDYRVEQVKGITYSLDALLGADPPPAPPGTPTSEAEPRPPAARETDGAVVPDREFANVNGIAYSLDQMLGTATTPAAAQPASAAPEQKGANAVPARHGPAVDASVDSGDALAHDVGVAQSMGVRPTLARRRSWEGARGLQDGNGLFFCVVYLAPGDYHRFHSPAAWVVERRRHFVGDLFSVSPYIARRLENLFVLNERIALLGRWRHGFFGMVPVGATNVGTIKINFDEQLRTNAPGRRPPPGTFTEATYAGASALLGGQPLAKAEEMGGFRLGSTIVLVFEAPKDFRFACEAGQQIKMGEPLGDVPSDK